MNFLAHLHLGPHTPEGMLGSLLGDFVRGRLDDPLLQEQFTPAVLSSIRGHRAIDAFTDENSHWKRSKYRLPAPLRRFAGIVVDVYYDHLLSIHWQRYMDTSREVFIDSCHAALLGSPALPDPQWRPFLERLVEENWLGSYASLKGIGITLDRISQRSPRVAPIAGSVVELEKNFASYEEDFLAFYPEVLGFVNADS